MKWLIPLFAFSLALRGATTYYVDAVSGNDGNLGTSSGAAWQTVSKVNSSSFSAGDSVLFKCGQTWREGLLFPSSGSAGNPITISSWSTGNRPIINGADVKTAWVQSTAAPTEWYLNESITRPGGVWVDNLYQTNAFYSGSPQNYAAGSLAANQWGWGDIDTLGFDTVYIYGDPTGKSVEVSTREYCFKASSKDYLTVSGLEFTHSGLSTGSSPAFYPYTSDNMIVTNCYIHDVSGTAGCIYVMRSSAFTLISSTVCNCYDPDNNAYGTLVYFESSVAGQCSSPVIKSNTLYGCYARLGDIVGFVGAWDVPTGIPYGTTNAVVQYNEIYGPAQNGVYFRSGATSNNVSYNYIHNIKGAGANGGIGTQLRDQANYNRVYNNLYLNNYGPVVQSDGKDGGPNSTDATCTGNQYLNNTIANGYGSICENNNRTDAMHFFGTNVALVVRNNLVVTHDAAMVMNGNSDATDHTYDGITLSNNRYYKTDSLNGSAFLYKGVNYATFALYSGAMTADGYPNESGSSYGDPSITNSSPTVALDLRLSPGSVCIAAGFDLSSVFADDYAGTARAASWDIGAYEYVPPSTTTARWLPFLYGRKP